MFNRYKSLTNANTSFFALALLAFAVFFVANNTASAQNQINPHPTFGETEAKINVIVFTDYNCPFCKRLEPHLQQLLKNHPDIKVTNVIVPLRQGNVAGSQVNSAQFALNVWLNQPDAFAETHQLLYAKNGMHNAQSLQQIAAKTGTQDALADPTMAQQIIDMNMDMFRDIGLRGTPSLIIDQQLIPGYVEYDVLADVVEKALAAQASR